MTDFVSDHLIYQETLRHLRHIASYVSRVSDTPDTSDTPVTSDTPETSNTLHTPETSDTPNTSETHLITDTSHTKSSFLDNTLGPWGGGAIIPEKYE